MSKPIDTNQILEELFKDSKPVSNQKHQLPSKGLPYGKDSDGMVSVKPLDFEDEKALASLKEGDSIVDEVIRRCSPDVDPDDLLISDKIFLTYKIREVSFGNTIKVSGPCRKCSSTNDLEIEIDKLPVEYAEDGYTGTVQAKLEDLSKDVVVRHPFSGDEKYLTSHNVILDNLWRFIESIGDVSSKPIITQAVKRLTSKDIKTIIRAIYSDNIGIQTTAKYICASCSTENIVSVPVTRDFFLLS